jgi:CRP/FNR family cyclic AMP-dependent transcriptional regulator
MDSGLLYTAITDHVQKHVSLTEEGKAFFIDLLQVKTLARKELLVREGGICRHESYVVAGCLRSFYTDKAGMEHTITFAVEDWWISDFISFNRQEPATRNIEALEPCTLLQITRPALESLYNRVPAFERFFRLLHQNAHMALDKRVLGNISLTGKQRYQALAAQYPYLLQRVPQKFIASYLGITPVFLSRIRKQLSSGEGD